MRLFEIESFYLFNTVIFFFLLCLFLVGCLYIISVRVHSLLVYTISCQIAGFQKSEPHLLKMASATRLPLKSIAFTTAVVAAAGISHVNIQKLLSDVFTGPGSYSRIAATVVILANLKSLPGVWHVCSPFLCTPSRSLYKKEMHKK